MKSSEEIMQEVKTIFTSEWSKREGQKIPEVEDIKLGNDAVTLDGTVLYADMTDSTGLVNGYQDWFAAEVYKTYLNAACNIIRNNTGVITAFDGDRVMSVFVGSRKNSLAAKAALQICYITREINKVLKTAYPTSAYELNQAIGIDCSPLFVARTGIRNSNDLVWVGRSANYAAKLCSLTSTPYTVFITDDVFKKLSEDAKYGGNPRVCMWEKTAWKEMGMTIYRSNWWWGF